MDSKKSYIWTTEEINFLKEWVGIYSVEGIANRLQRTPKGVLSKLNRLGITNMREVTGTMSLLQLARAVGVSRSVITRWIQLYGLPAKKKNYYYYKTRKIEHYSIYPDEFWKWAEKNKDKINFANVKRYAILPEPEWFEAELRKDAAQIAKKHHRSWNELDDKRLLQMREKGLTAREIGEQLGRTARAVQARIARLRKNNVQI